MSRKSILFCLLAVALFTACLEEDSGLAELLDVDGNTTYVINDAAEAGKGLPRSAVVEVVTFSDEKGDVVYEKQMHVGLEFRDCTSGWCQARVDDCGSATRVKYNYLDNGGEQSIAFTDFQNTAALRGWALDGTPFQFTREGKKVSLTCKECPGQIQPGLSFTQREVTLLVSY